MILLIVFLIVIFSIKDARKAVLDIIRLLLVSIKIIIPFIGMVLYISLILFILTYLGFLNINMVKNVIFWFAVAIYLFFKANEVTKDKNFFKTKAVEYVGLTTVIGFIINFYTFNLLIEIVLQIIIFALILLIAVSKTQEKYKPVEKFLSTILFIILACLVIIFLNNLFTNPNEFININTGITFILPGILTVLLLPFIYLLALYISYDLFYARLKIVLNGSKLYKYVFKEVFKRYNLDLYGLDAFLSEFRIFNIQSSGDVGKEILNAEKRVKSQNENIK